MTAQLPRLCHKLDCQGHNRQSNFSEIFGCPAWSRPHNDRTILTCATWRAAMLRQKITKAMFCISLLAGTLAAQTPVKVDFGRDVLPLLRQNCVGCHGPTKQMNSYRLDRRSVALRGPAPVIVPSNSAASRLYLRLTASDFGSPMPPSGPLKPEDVTVIKAWIDQGASWPDELANEADLPPLNPKAVA